MITTVQLPTGQIWLDSTPEVAPYRLLVAAVRDKPALVIPASGASTLEQTPALPPYPFFDHFLATGALKTDGEFDAHMQIEDRSDSEIILRGLARLVAPAQWDKATNYLSVAMGFSGSTSNSSFAAADNFSVPMQVSWDYTRKPYGDWDNFRIVAPFPLIELPSAPDQKPSEDLDLGAPRTDTAVARITLPANYSANLPNPVHVKTAFASFDETYGLEEGVLNISRTLVVLQPKLAAASWQDYKKFAGETSLNEQPYIQLTSTATSGSGPHPPAAGASNPVVAELMSESMTLLRSPNWSEATKKLDEVKTIQPDQPYLWSSYGFIAMLQGKLDDAETDVNRELALHPDETNVVMMDVNLLHRRKKDGEACALLQASLQRDPSNVQMVLELARLQAISSVPDAIATLRKATAAMPQNSSVSTALASYLHLNHQDEEAAAIFKKVLDQSQDALVLNNASYELAETGSDLPLAEEKARQAVGLLNQASRVDIGSANQQSFQQASLLVMAWDTLGFILLHENKLEEAFDYLDAAWHNDPSLTIGLHYGDALEKLGRNAEALWVDQLSWNGNASVSRQDALQMKSAIRQLEQAGVKASIDERPMGPQHMRIFQIPQVGNHPSDVSAIFRLQIQAGGIHDVLRVSGDASLDAEEGAVRKLVVPSLVPAHSDAYLLRDAGMYCEPDRKSCELVLKPLGSIAAEQERN